MTQPQFSDLLAYLYRAPLDPSGWQQFLSTLSQMTGAVGGAMVHHNLRDHVFEIRAISGVAADPDLQREYNEHYGALDPWREPFMARGTMQITHGSELVPLPQLRQTEFYHDYMRRYRVLDVTLIPATLDPADVENLSFWRAPGEGPLDAASMGLLEAIHPHLCAAVEIQHRLAGAVRRAETAEHAASSAERSTAGAQAMLDAIACPVLLLDSFLVARRWNCAAERLLTSGALALHGGLLRVSPLRQPAFDAMLRRALAMAECAPHPGQPNHRNEPASAVGEMLPLERAGRRPLIASAVPLRLEQEMAGSPAHVLLMISDPEAHAEVPLEALRSLYGVSPTEAAIANGLLEGLTLADIARRRRLTEDTARSHLKSLFRRTGTNRQTELVLLLGNLPQANCPHR